MAAGAGLTRLSGGSPCAAWHAVQLLAAHVRARGPAGLALRRGCRCWTRGPDDRAVEVPPRQWPRLRVLALLLSLGAPGAILAYVKHLQLILQVLGILQLIL